MLRSRMIQVAAIVSVVMALVLCLPTTVCANGTKGPTEREKEEVTPPSGRGPTEAAAAISIAPISAIRRRGHVDNMAEELAMMQQMVKEKGAERTFGDYRVAYMLDAPQGWYEMRDGKLTWRPPAPGETQHIEIAVLDSLTGKPLPMSPITVDVVDSQGNTVQSQQLAYIWDPMVDHYGANFSIPTAGTYTLRIRAPAPNILRHNQELGDRFTAPLDASFSDVRIGPKAPSGTTEETIPPTGGGPTQPEQPSEPPSTPPTY